MSDLNKRVLNVNMTGIVNAHPLVAATSEFGSDWKFLKLHLHNIHLKVSGSATVKLYIGSQEVFDRTGTGSHEYHTEDENLNGVGNSLKISVDSNVTVTGQIYYSWV